MTDIRSVALEKGIQNDLSASLSEMGNYIVFPFLFLYHPSFIAVYGSVIVFGIF